MRISLVQGYPDGDGYTVEFKAGGQVFLIRNCPSEQVPSTSMDIRLITPPSGGPFYRIEGISCDFSEVLRSRLTDLIVLEAFS